MIDCFEIIGLDPPLPKAKRIIFCAGTDGGHFQPESDLELSHWRLKQTPVEYRAGTNYLEQINTFYAGSRLVRNQRRGDNRLPLAVPSL